MLVSLSALADRPQRIVSIGLCTDQLLLMLADRGQIASLSVWAKDANMSYMIDSVGDIPLNNASIEEVVRLQPDLVLASEFVAWDTVSFLRQLGYPVEQVPVVKSVDEIYQLLGRFGAWTGNPDRAHAMAGQMRRRLPTARSFWRLDRQPGSGACDGRANAPASRRNRSPLR
jgi:iron complex transport system substrate-binding protein